MVDQNNTEQFINDDEISLKELILKIKEWYIFLRTKWKLILLMGLVGGAIGFTYAYRQPTTYKAVLTFALEEDKGGGASGLVPLHEPSAALGRRQFQEVRQNAPRTAGLTVSSKFCILPASPENHAPLPSVAETVVVRPRADKPTDRRLCSGITRLRVPALGTEHLVYLHNHLSFSL